MQYPVFLPNVELNMEGVSVSAWLVKVGAFRPARTCGRANPIRSGGWVML